MKEKATLEEWKELYEVTVKIKELNPWKYFWDVDIITLILPENEEPVYCSVMGRGGEFYGIGFYFGFDALDNFYKIIETTDMPPEQIQRFQEDNVIICYFGDREELFKEELQIVKALGLKFRGRNNWIYFRSFKKGYAPYILNKEEVLKQTAIMRHLLQALKNYIEEDIVVNFEEGETLVHKYDEQKNEWVTLAAPLLLPQRKYLIPILKDELLLSRMAKQTTTSAEIEVDIAYLNTIIRDKEYDRPIAGRICILADSKSGMIIDQHILSPEDNEVQYIFDMVIPYILNMGKPKKIFVRDEYLFHLLVDLCERTKIGLHIKSRLNAIDYFIEEFVNFR
jgi:hypothetical protein